MNKPRIIAFYLPQFHPIPENDEWWGKGFTEWTNVGKAKSLFPGHNQPKIPTELGYYDLRLTQVQKEQVEMAKEAGVEGFCYWHYYFGNGKQLLETPLRNVIKDSSIDFPFCLGWANEPWEYKLWNKDGSGNRTLIAQEYNGKEDYRKHFEIILPCLKDNRYIKIDGKFVFLIYKPRSIPNIQEFFTLWRRWAKEELHKDFYFIAHAYWNENNFEDYYSMGFDGVYSNRIALPPDGFWKRHVDSFRRTFLGWPRLYDYKKVIENCISEDDKKENVFPSIICGWDHTPRSGKKGMVYINFTLENFRKHVKDICKVVENKEDEHKVIFLKSWNEWGEGNFMEPDLEFGRGKIETLKSVLKEIEG